MGPDRVTEMAHVTKLLCLIKEILNNNHSWLWGFLKGGFEYRQRIKISTSLLIRTMTRFKIVFCRSRFNDSTRGVEIYWYFNS